MRQTSSRWKFTLRQARILNFPSLFPTLPSAQSPIPLMNAASVNAQRLAREIATGAIIDPTAYVGV
jgi:hypothetical protein